MFFAGRLKLRNLEGDDVRCRQGMAEKENEGAKTALQTMYPTLDGSGERRLW
jgi:hypothetical protein